VRWGKMRVPHNQAESLVAEKLSNRA
jgi:hypothetical protein